MLRKNKLQYLVCSLMLVLFTASCSKDNDTDNGDNEQGKEQYVSVAPAASLTKAQLQVAASASGFGAFTSALQYDVDYFKLTYNTTFNGKTIQASGLVGIPKNMTAAPAILSAQHGTMFADADAPSNFPATSTGFELFASAGFVTVIPDFIGFGVSKNIIHPYYDMPSSGIAVVDMIKAVKYYLKSQSKSVSSKLFLIGYSEGGYVTMAAQREIETNSSHGLTVTAAAEGAGGYDITGMLAKIGTATTYPSPSFFSIFIQSYNSLYGFNRPLTDYFNATYAAKINNLLDGSKNGTQINNELTTNLTGTNGLFNPTFFAALNNASAETAFKAKVAANSFPNWAPKSQTRLYHGTADADVFYETTQSTYNRFIAAGSTNVTLKPITGGTHATSVVPMISDALPWFILQAQ